MSFIQITRNLYIDTDSISDNEHVDKLFGCLSISAVLPVWYHTLTLTLLSYFNTYCKNKSLFIVVCLLSLPIFLHSGCQGSTFELLWLLKQCTVLASKFLISKLLVNERGAPTRSLLFLFSLLAVYHPLH